MLIFAKVLNKINMKNNIKPIIKSLRLSVTIPAALLVHVGFAVSGQGTDWTIVVMVFFIACMTMLVNDYSDRHHDLQKDL